MMYALQSRLLAPSKPKRYWTGQEYSEDLTKALTFPDLAAAERCMKVRGYRREYMQPVEITINQGGPANANQT